MRRATIESDFGGGVSQAEGPGPRACRETGPNRASGPDPFEIDQVVARLRPKLEAAALRVTREPEAASDVVQQAALKALRFRHQFRGGAALSTWIYRIVLNEALLWRRGQRRRATVLERLQREMPEPCGRGTTSPEELLDRRRQLRAVARGLERLGPGDRDVLVQLFGPGHALGEPTPGLGIPRTALRTRIFRARKRLARLVETA
jgi:RNA polymerase sigma-70 factor (ECF subfamily)